MFHDWQLIDYHQYAEPFSHSSKLTTMIEAVLLKYSEPLSAIAISGGPGSYTGLRIGASTAKGLCYGLDIPLISINTLQLMAEGFRTENKVGNNELILALMDARRMEVYAAAFDNRLNFILQTEAIILEENSFVELSSVNQKIHIIGNGAHKSEAILKSGILRFYLEGNNPDALYMGRLAYDKYQNNDFEDVAYYEPFYLKEFFFAQKKNP